MSRFKPIKLACLNFNLTHLGLKLTHLSLNLISFSLMLAHVILKPISFTPKNAPQLLLKPSHLLQRPASLSFQVSPRQSGGSGSGSAWKRHFLGKWKRKRKRKQ